jgi:hypothetical protein
VQAYAGALRPRQNVYSRALEDIMSSPVIKFIDTRHYTDMAGDRIVTCAFDDFRVTAERARIYPAVAVRY